MSCRAGPAMGTLLGVLLACVGMQWPQFFLPCPRASPGGCLCTRGASCVERGVAQGWGGRVGGRGAEGVAVGTWSAAGQASPSRGAAGPQDTRPWWVLSLNRFCREGSGLFSEQPA